MLGLETAMIDTRNRCDLLGGGISRLALGVSILAALLLLVPFGLASIGFGALLGVAGGLEAPSEQTIGDHPTTDPPVPATLLP
jgi:hypothetical protein